jgi:FkbM family methyltransferase
MQIKAILKRALQNSPFRVIRRGLGNRFQAIDDLLANLNRRRFSPSYVIDGGANVGEFSKLARRIWPDAVVHMIEPQQSCRPALEELCRGSRFKMHMVALGDKTGAISLAADSETTSTGAHIIENLAAATGPIIEVPVVTLDDLFLSELITVGPILLKMDLQGYELHALRGGSRSLQLIDAILMEVSFYAQAYEPSVSTLVRFMDESGFELHDIGALSGRSRDSRAHQADFLFVKRGTLLAQDTSWA